MAKEDQEREMRNRLKSISSKKIDTAMIYPLNQFELFFGHLWGHGKEDSQLTEEEKLNRQRWEECRKKVLDNGNRQKRGLLQELDMHTVTWDRYTTVFYKRS